MSALSNWTNGNNVPVCADTNPYSVWSSWGASQRDLFVLDHQGNVVLDENISGGIPQGLEELVIELINNIPDCDPNLICAQAITCCDGLLYPTGCCADNCDAPIGECEEQECVDGELNNDNPCNPMECFNGEWIEIIIDCAEQMGVPCDGGIYIPPEEGECCSTCIITGDINNDGIVNIIDVVTLVNFVLDGDYSILADINSDGSINVIDIVSLVSIILG